MEKLEGKVAVITGASKGIGEGIAKVYAKYGAKCVLAARGQKVLELAEELRKQGYEAIGVQTDVSDFQSVEKLVCTAEETYGPVDILVNNAGICVLEDFLSADSFENRDKHFDINIKGVWNTTKAVLPSMFKTGAGAIADAVPLGRLADPTEIGELAAFLGSSESSYITGAQIVIDGGSTLPETTSMGQ